jgi:hypothetical protein
MVSNQRDGHLSKVQGPVLLRQGNGRLARQRASRSDTPPIPLRETRSALAGIHAGAQEAEGRVLRLLRSRKEEVLDLRTQAPVL